MYRIKITKVEYEDCVTSEYEKIADSGNEKDDGAVYDYVEHPDSKLVETDMLSQTVVDLDFPAVIKAINKI